MDGAEPLSVLLMIGCIDGFLSNDSILGCEHVELGVFEDLIGIGELSHTLLDGLWRVGRLPEHHGLLVELALQLGGLRVEPVVVSHLLAEVGVFPEGQRTCTSHGHGLEQANTLVHVSLRGDVRQSDLPALEEERHGEESRRLAAILLIGCILAPVFVFLGVVAREVEPQIVHILH